MSQLNLLGTRKVILSAQRAGRTMQEQSQRRMLDCFPNWLREALGTAGEAFELARDTVSERSGIWTRNPLGSVRRDSNPFGVAVGGPI